MTKRDCVVLSSKEMPANRESTGLLRTKEESLRNQNDPTRRIIKRVMPRDQNLSFLPEARTAINTKLRASPQTKPMIAPLVPV